MKAKSNYFIFIIALMLLVICSVLVVACSSKSGESIDDEVNVESAYINTEELDLETSQQISTSNKSNAKKYIAKAASSSSAGTGIYIGGVEITSDRWYGSGWTYSSSSNTLTLNGYYSPTSRNNTVALSKDLYPKLTTSSSQAHLWIDSRKCTSLTIKVKGEYASSFGVLDDTDNYDEDNYSYYGIYAPDVDLVLDIEDDYAPMKYNPVYYPLQIYTHRDAVVCKNLTITGGGGLRADSTIGSGIICQDLSVSKSRLICRTQSGNNIYHGIVGHTGAAILATGSVTFNGGSAKVYVQNTAPKVGSVWAAYQIDVYGIKANSLYVMGNASVTVEMSFASDVTQNVSFKATGINASTCTSYDGGRLRTKISTNDTMPTDAFLSGCNIENYTYFLGGNTTVEGELLSSGSKSFKLDSFMQTFPLPGGSMSTSIGDTKYSYKANISAIYLRNNEGKFEYATNYLFNDPTTLSSNEIDMADFSDQNVYSVSGDWRIKPIPGDNKSTFIVLSGSITLEMSNGNTYDSFGLYAYTGATIYVSGDGIVNSLNATGCNEIGVERFISFGTVYFKGGTVKSGWVNSGLNAVFYDGNINVDYNDESTYNPYHKWVFDFGEYADLVNFKSDITFSSSTFDCSGLYPIDGKLYSWDRYQTSGVLYRLVKYAVVKQDDGGMYYLYPEKTEEGTFTMQRLAETEVFIPNSNIDSNYYLANGDTLTLSSGTFGKQVTRPATTFGGSSSTEIFGETTTIIPDGFSVRWTRTDKDGNSTQVGTEISLSVQLKALQDDGSVYTCTILQGNTQVNELTVHVFVFDYNSIGLAPKLAGAGETISFSFSFDVFKGYNDWIVNNYIYIWQIDEDGSGDFVDIDGTVNQNNLSVTITSDDSYKALYRVKCYSSGYYVSGSSMKSFPTFYTTSTKATFRELPYFNGVFSVSPSNDDYVGSTKYYSISLKNCFIGFVDVWYEYSADDGQTWQQATSNSAFENGVDIILQSRYLSPYGTSQVIDSWYMSKSLSAKLSAEMNGWKLRCVMKSGDYVVYSNEATLTVLDFAQFNSQPEELVVIKSFDSLTLSASFDEDYTDEEGNGISDITYEWMYETWSNGNYDKVDTANKITTTTLFYENVSGIGSVSRYSLKVKFTYKGNEYTRYSDYAYVYILYQPTFDEGGIVVDNMVDGIYTEGDNVSWAVKDNSVFFHYYKTYQFEISNDGGDTWQNVGDAFTQSYLNTDFTFGLQNLSVADSGLYRLKVSITKYDVTVSSYSDIVNLGIASNPLIDDSQGYAATNTSKLELSAKHEYSSNLSVTYKWQGYDSDLGWVELSGEDYFDVDKQTMYTLGASMVKYEKYRCLVNYKLNDDNNRDVYSDEVTPILIVKPTVTASPVDQTVWLGNSVNFILLIDNPTENYTILWEISNDGGETWENAVAARNGEPSELDYSLFCNTTTYSMNGAMFRCTVTNAIGDVSESVVTEPVTLIVKSGHVRSESELLDALENGMTEFKLLDDISLSATLLIERSIALDLNGHVLSNVSGSVIKITNDATLTLTDSMPVSVHSDDELPLGGVIIGGSGSVLGIDDNSTFGGGVLIEKGKLIFIGGTIYNCRATYGGGVYVSDSSYLSLEGGTIDNCSATEGGGIYSEGDIDIKDGNISNCTSSNEDENNNSNALYLKESTLNALGGTVDGTVTLEESSVVMPEGSVNSTGFLQNVYCNNSSISGGFYLSDVIGVDAAKSATITYMNGDQLVKKLIVEIGQKAISISISHDKDKLLVWFNGDTVYDFNDQVFGDLVLSARLYVTSDVQDDLDETQNELDNTKSELDKTNAALEATKSELDQTKTELDETNDELDETKSELAEIKSQLDDAKNDVNEAQTEIDSLNSTLNNATEDINNLNDKLSSVTAWMIVSIVLFGLSCGAIATLVIIFYRKKKQSIDNND